MKRTAFALWVLLGIVGIGIMPAFGAEAVNEQIVVDHSGVAGVALDSAPTVPFDRLISAYRKEVGPSSFGKWELKGRVERVGGIEKGDDLSFKIGKSAIRGKGMVARDTSIKNVKVTMVELKSDSATIGALIPGGPGSSQKLFGQLPPGVAHLLLMSARNQKKQEMVHYYHAEWAAEDFTIHNDGSPWAALFFTPLIKNMPFPYGGDAKVEKYDIKSATANIRYYPAFYTKQKAKELFGNSKRIDDTVVSIEMTVLVPNKVLMINTPHKYTLNLRNLPIRALSRQMEQEKGKKQK